MYIRGTQAFCSKSSAFEYDTKRKPKAKAIKIKPRKPPTKAESFHMSKVAAVGCIACIRIGYSDTPAEVHHLRDGAGAGQRSGHYSTIPLCPHHHRHGKNAIHQSKVNFEADFGTELELLEMVNRLIKVAA
jgi:hypothetical protein